ncbi:uncharacterized protein LOC112529087 [Cynara cardunculus var. scolymus]|uniref:uncharacterized protein LOC112529087 n=1 Tax=Cynara cardunculus var. scolymus TaxID=59895 RepID=UPI000D623BFB|nr:uncharacterized protein LOC112529087 [Cynara cardunculus var. scolymus]
MAAGDIPISDSNQRILNHYPVYLNFMAVLFALVIQMRTLSPRAMNQLRVAVIVFTVNVAASLGVQQTSNGSIRCCSRAHRRLCVFRTIFYVTMLVTPVILLFIFVVEPSPWHPILEYFHSIWSNIKNLVFGETAVATALPPPEIEDSVYRRISVGVYNFLGRPTDPILPVSMPPPTTASRWSSVTSSGRRFLDLKVSSMIQLLFL